MRNTMRSNCVRGEHLFHRRELLAGALGGVATAGFGGVDVAAEHPVAEKLKGTERRVLMIWLAGGASQFEMWDPKPGRTTGGPFRSIPTAVSGYHVCELMPKLAQRTQQLAIIRSMNTEITAHAPAADVMSTGHRKEAALVYPEIGVVLSKELAVPTSDLPSYVSLFLSSEGRRRPGTGFFGKGYSPLILEESLRPKNIDLPAGLNSVEHQQREELRALLSRQFAAQRAGNDLAAGYNGAYAKVHGLMRNDHLFDLEKEPKAVQARYGRTVFGRHCLLARRLLEAGVPVVKVARGFWDSHHDNFESHRELVPDFDNVFSVLLDDLGERGLLANTTIIVFSEFGRTPKINKDVGRDHYAAAWSCLFAGAGVRGGTIVGKTDKDGISVSDAEMNAGDLAATFYRAVGLDPHKSNYVGPRPVPLAPEDAVPNEDLLA